MVSLDPCTEEVCTETSDRVARQFRAHMASTQGGATILASFAQNILAVAPMAIFAVDDRGRVQSANSAADLMFGAPLITSPFRRLEDILSGLPPAALNTQDGVDAFNSRARPRGCL